ncbi:MAG TPA: PAS domain S-box protein [Cellvibrio sp.]|nr:PAS domain S-box protein [Cellvibrio sp.]
MRNQAAHAMTKAQILLTAIISAETGTRGYLITGDQALLKPYLDVRDKIAIDLEQLRQSSFVAAEKKHLDRLVPLTKERMTYLAKAVELRQQLDIETLLKTLNIGRGMQLMDSIRTELQQYQVLQQAQIKFYEESYRNNMNWLFAFIVFASIFMLLFAQAFAYGIYRNIHQRLMNLVHLETKRSLDQQEALNYQLNLAYLTLQDSEKKLEVTLNSIADAVIATDREARVTVMNHVAELLTGWTHEEALGCPIADIFHIVDKETREPMTIPVVQTLLHGVTQGSNDNILIVRNGRECNIANSCAPIRDHDGLVIGTVLVFRDITAENTAKQALLDSTELVQTILATVVDGIVTINARTNLIETVNAAAEKMFGYSAEELIGERFSKIVPEQSEENNTLGYSISTTEKRANGIVREVTGQVKGGHSFPMEIAISEMRLGGQGYYTCVLRNITARKHAERVMQESEDRYHNLFDTIDEGFCVAEMIYDNEKPVDCRFLEVNPSFAKQSGLAAEPGNRLLELAPDIETDWFYIFHEVVQTGEPTRFIKESKNLHRWFDVYTCRLGAAGSQKVAILLNDVTERKRSEQALLESDQRVRLATEATGVGIWEWNLSSNVMRWDAQMFRIYGVAPTPDGTVSREQWVNCLLPEDRSSQEILDKAIDSSEGNSREFRIHRDGEKEIRHIKSVETMRTNDQGHVESIVGTNLDITELKRTEETLRESERHLRRVIDALPVAIYTTDAEGKLTHYNQTAVEFSGRTPILGTDQWCISWKLFATDGSPLPHDRCPMAISLKEGDHLHGAEAIAERPDGTRVWFTAYPTPLHDAQGNLTGGINMLIDITERKRLDQLILENNIELKKAKNLAEKANLAKSDFLSNMSHELRTPLSAILGFAQLLEASTPPPTPNQKRSVDQILQAGWYLLDLINEILDLTLVESGRLSLSMETVSLPDLMRECKTMIEPLALKRNITLNFPQFTRSITVRADQTRLKQALINLLSNAVKYNRENGKVTVTCTELASKRLRICVQDTGEGLPPEKLSQLFQPFNRLGKENSSEEGTGIGLVMTKRLIKLMGGKINAKSKVGEGSRFSIEIDLATEEQASHPETVEIFELPSKPMRIEGEKYTLLYVEDNPANLSLIEDIIAPRSDLFLLSARDGYSGIELARMAQPDLILMDINLPGINGIEVLKILAKDPITMHIPVIALSANAIPRDIENGLKAGFFRYLTKPIKINEFLDTLEVALEFATKKPTKAKEEKIT